MPSSTDAAVLHVAGQVVRDADDDEVVGHRRAGAPRVLAVGGRVHRAEGVRRLAGDVPVGPGDDGRLDRVAGPAGRSAPWRGRAGRAPRRSPQMNPSGVKTSAVCCGLVEDELLERVLTGGQEQLGGRPVELVRHVVVVVRPATVGAGRRRRVDGRVGERRGPGGARRRQERVGEVRVVLAEEPGTLRGHGGDVERRGRRRTSERPLLRVVRRAGAAGRSSPRRGPCGAPCRRTRRTARSSSASTRAPSAPRRARRGRRCRARARRGCCPRARPASPTRPSGSARRC